MTAPRWFGRAHGLSTRRRILEVAFDAAFVGGWPSRIARLVGWTGTLGVDAREVDAPIPAGVAAPPTLRIGFVSDLHAGPATHPRIIADALGALERAQVDLLLLGGDYVSFHARHFRGVLPLLARIPAPLGRFAVMGNHDLIGDDRWLEEQLREAGVRTLLNESIRLPAPWDGVTLCGLDNHEEGDPDAGRAFAGASDVRILLAHSPDSLTDAGDRDFALMLCGHVHGGQFYRPGGASLLNFHGPLSRKYLRGGLFPVGPRGDQPMLVSRGLGQGTLPARRGADPQVHVLTVRFVPRA